MDGDLCMCAHLGRLALLSWQFVQNYRCRTGGVCRWTGRLLWSPVTIPISNATPTHHPLLCVMLAGIQSSRPLSRQLEENLIELPLRRCSVSPIEPLFRSIVFP